MGGDHDLAVFFELEYAWFLLQTSDSACRCTDSGGDSGGSGERERLGLRLLDRLWGRYYAAAEQEQQAAAARGSGGGGRQCAAGHELRWSGFDLGKYAAGWQCGGGCEHDAGQSLQQAGPRGPRQQQGMRWLCLQCPADFCSDCAPPDGAPAQPAAV